jgi:hypothetical protein
LARKPKAATPRHHKKQFTANQNPGSGYVWTASPLESSRRGGIGISVDPRGKASGVNDSQVIYRQA